MMRPVQKLTFSALLIAIGVLTGNVIYIPIGVSKVFPVQHFINVVSAVFLGPSYAVLNAFVISLIRMLFGTGSALAFPGSMIGALLAGLIFAKTKKIILAACGEVVGTGILGALLSVPLAKLVYGTNVAAFYYILPFLLSTVFGSVLAVIILTGLQSHRTIKKYLIGEGLPQDK